MSMKILSVVVLLALFNLNCTDGVTQSGDKESGAKNSESKYLKISGVYPHLAVFNEGGGLFCAGNGGEGGIGAVTPWAGKLWMVTYSAHCPGGSSDKLYSIDENLQLHIHPESVGGTPANRLIHTKSDQLITGPYFIDSKGKVRVIPPSVMPGRWTATATHLTDPDNMVYMYDMEGALFEVNVHTLAVKKLFQKPIPGWHGKGGYTAQNKLILANNGEHQKFDIDPALLQVGGEPKNKEEMGVLATWDGKKWEIVERRQFTDVTGPGGIYGSPDNNAPAWSIGWDKRSVILKLLDDGKWFTYRMPKATHTYDHWGGWYTEWPRIREIGNNKMLMDMHGMFYDFPKTFTRANSGGITPIGSHLRYIPDFCNWNGQLVLSTDETTILQNAYPGRSQSNLWFGKLDDLRDWGSVNGWGGPWINDAVVAGQPSDAYLINGTDKKVLHLSHKTSSPVTFTLEIDRDGNNKWENYKKVTVAANGYEYLIFPADFKANWIRLTADKNCSASAFFHYQGKGHEKADPMFAGLADIEAAGEAHASLIRPAAHNKNLQVLNIASNGALYQEVNEKLQFSIPAADSSERVAKVLALKKEFETDDASVIVKDATGSYRLPKTSAVYDKPFAAGWPRAKREVESERYMFNAHGTLYEIGRESGFASIKPVTTHKKKIVDFCTWRGLLVISGTRSDAAADGHYFTNGDKSTGLWFGAIDDLWKLGKPVGEGGLWKNTAVNAGENSLPFLMTGYDKKKISLTSDKDVEFTLEIDVDHNGFHEFKKIKVPAGKTVDFDFPEGFNAHWIRAKTDKSCKATAWIKYS
jgi:hypothetical protein